MEKRAIDVAKALVRLSALTIFELRGEWRRLHRMPPPMRLSRDLLIRGIIYQLQERAYGGRRAGQFLPLRQFVDLQHDREIFLTQIGRLGLELMLQLAQIRLIGMSGFR